MLHTQNRYRDLQILRNLAEQLVLLRKTRAARGARLCGLPVRHRSSVGLGMMTTTGNSSAQTDLDAATDGHCIERQNLAFFPVFRFRGPRSSVHAQSSRIALAP